MSRRHAARPVLESMEVRLALSHASAHPAALVAAQAHHLARVAHVEATHHGKFAVAATHHHAKVVHVVHHTTTTSSSSSTNSLSSFFKSVFPGL